MKVDVLVDDGVNVISQTSYVFPTRLLQLGSSYGSDSFDQSGIANDEWIIFFLLEKNLILFIKNVLIFVFLYS